MFLRRWLRGKRPPNPVPEEVDRINRQTEELRRVVAQLKLEVPRHERPSS